MTISKSLCIIAVLCIAGTASAQQAPSFTEDFDQATNGCFASCEANPDHRSAPAQTAAPAAKASVKSTAAASTTKRVKRSNGTGGGARATATATVRVDSGRVGKLEGRVSELERRVGGHDADIAALRQELEELKAASASAEASATASADGGAVSDKENIAVLMRLYVRIEQRLTVVEDRSRSPFGNSVGLSLGLMLLSGSNAMSFASPYVSAKVHLGLSNDYFLYVEPSLMIAPGDLPFSAGLGGGIGRRLFGDGELGGALEFGVQQVALAIKNDLNAKAMATLGNVGFSVRLPHDFRVGGNIYMGAGFTASADPTLVIGGGANIGYDFR